jgi:hypothetical protein
MEDVDGRRKRPAEKQAWTVAVRVELPRVEWYDRDTGNRPVKTTTDRGVDVVWGCLMASRLSVVISITTLAVCLPVTMSAQNLVVNPDFDTDLTGWSGIGVWDPLDAFGSPTSGSATWVNTQVGGGAIYLDQCVELTPFFEGYDLSG